MADDSSGEEELIKNGAVNSSEGSAVGSSELSIFLDPARLNVSVRNNEGGLFQLLFKIGNELFVG